MAAGETYVVYGDLMLWNCLTPPGGFRQEPVMDESGTDLLYYRFTIRVIGWITAYSLSAGQVGALPNSGAGAGSKRANMSYAVSPRQHFEYHTGAQVDGNGNIANQGSTVIICDPIVNANQVGQGTVVDVTNGPRCTHFDVTQVVADNLFRVEAEFEISVLACNLAGGTANQTGVLSNRWSVEDIIDRDRMTTRIISGRLVCSTATINPNVFRNFVVPSLQPGMVRASIDIVAAANGLTLLYTITDVEIAYSAPAPATSWSFEHTESASREGQLSRYGECRITLKGDRNVDHKKLISLGVAIAEAKLVRGLANNQCFIMENTVTDRYGDDENGVSIIVRGKRFPKDGEALLGLPTKLLGVPISPQDIAEVTLGYDPRLSRGGRTGEGIELSGPIPIAAAFSAYLQSPCNDFHQISSVTPVSSSGTVADTPKTSISLSTSQDLTDDSSNSYFNNSANTAIYTYYQMESTYETDSMRVHVPVAVSGLSQSSFGSGGTGNPQGSTGSNVYAASGSQQTSAIIALAPPMTKRRVRIKGERVGTWPDLPAVLSQDGYQDSNGITYALLNIIERPVQPERTVDGKQLYLIDREYVFAMSRAPNASDNLAVGVNPWETAGLVLKAYDGGTPETSYPLS